MKATVLMALTILGVVLLLSACNQKGKVTGASPEEATAGVTGKEYVEVLVFHGTKQCETCEAIKKNTKEVVDEKFADPAKAGKVVFRIVDFSRPENEPLAEKYEIAWTSVVLVKHESDGKEQVKNIGKFAVENARANTELYRRRLEEEIKTFLN